MLFNSARRSSLVGRPQSALPYYGHDVAFATRRNDLAPYTPVALCREPYTCPQINDIESDADCR
jgi:hypothetical protein